MGKEVRQFRGKRVGGQDAQCRVYESASGADKIQEAGVFYSRSKDAMAARGVCRSSTGIGSSSHKHGSRYSDLGGRRGAVGGEERRTEFLLVVRLFPLIAYPCAHVGRRALRKR